VPRKRKSSGYLPPVLPQDKSRFGFRIRPPAQPSPNYAGDTDPAYPDQDEAAPKRGHASGLDDDQFQAMVRTAVQNCKDYDTDQVKPSRLKAWKFFDGTIDLPVNEGGSAVVSFDVRDAVASILPSMMRVFLASDEIGEFRPTNGSQAEWAPLASTYVSQLLRTRLGAIELRGVMQDAFMGRVGVVKWWWEDGKRVRTQKYTGLDDLAFAQATDPEDEKTEIEIVEKDEYEQKPSVEVMAAYQLALANAQGTGQQPPPPPQPQTLIDCIVRYTSTTRRLCMAGVPPEERLMDPSARNQETANYRGHRRVLKVYQLVNMGYDRDLCIEHATVDQDDEFAEDKAERQPEGVGEPADDLPGDDMLDVEYAELWINADRDGDGVAELIKVCTLGNACHIVDEEESEQVSMAEFQAIPRPHSVTGDSLANNLLDVQTMKSALLRGLMESLPHSIYPRYAALEGKVNWDDLLSTLPGQPVRTKDVNAITPLTVPFVGQAALDVMTFVDESIKEPRTGVSKVAMGLDPDALQSTPSVAAGSVMTASQSQLEDFARCLAETGWKTLMQGILREVVTNQRDPEWMKINGNWKPVDPRPWSADLEFIVDPAIGSGDNSKKIVVMQGIAAAQAEAAKALGPNNPLIGMKEIYNAQRRIAMLGNVPNPEAYWKDPGDAPIPAPPGQGQPADPSAALAAAEIQKAKIADDTKRYQIKLEDDRLRDKQRSDIVLAYLKIAADSGQTIDPGPLIASLGQPHPNNPASAPPPNPQLTAGATAQ
jgi:hypothetical protein